MIKHWLLRVGVCCVAGVLALATFSGRWEQQVSYNQDIRPIFNQHCLRCHGGIKQSGGFSLLFPEEMLDTTDAGIPAIVPGKAGKSELVRRLTHADPEMRMPYEADPLSEKEIKLIEKWIDQGAKWEDHWAYISPAPSLQPPSVSDGDWGNNEIDAFVEKRMKENDLLPNPSADKAVLLRRLSLDLIGLPPTPEEMAGFLRDTTSYAYEQAVDRLLTSPHFGERWASLWLDLARYADSKGYEKDLYRSIWKYRDWVIEAFNQDMPFDQFTVEQLAGDLIPHATASQRIATAFHRNTMANDEGGTDNEEFRNYALIERVGTTFEVWQGTTMACVQCHSHPYDPFRHEDFYRFMAYFNNTQDRDIYHEAPNVFTYEPTEKQEVQQILSWLNKQVGKEMAWDNGNSLHEQKEEALYALGHRKVEAELFSESSSFIELMAPDQKAIWQIQDTSWVRFDAVDLTEIEAVSYRYVTPYDGWVEVRLDHPHGPVICRTYLAPTARENDKKKWEKWNIKRAVVEPTSGVHDVYFVFHKHRHQTQDLFRIDWFEWHEKNPLKAQYGTQLQARLDSLYAIQPIPTPILQELPADQRRKTHLFQRGNWLVKGEEVIEGIPGYFVSSHDPMPANRLEMAEWLVHPNNPLTARVMVNRFWEQLFGKGLIETTEDLGSQGAAASHPELLDWLAKEFVTTHGWSIKRLLREMVLSATYQQSAVTDPVKFQQDPSNTWLARSPRVRLSAEQVRDQVLAVSGLFNPKMYGPSVRPPLPQSVADLSFGDRWVVSDSVDQHRRSVYTYIKRTSLFPNRGIFDGTDRTVCTSRRIRTNTPLQALSMLNNPAYVEAAHALAEYMNELEQDSLGFVLSKGYERVMLKGPSTEKIELLVGMYEEAHTHFTADTLALQKWMPTAEEEDAHLAALAMVANTLLNLDEFITK